MKRYGVVVYLLLLLSCKSLTLIEPQINCVDGYTCEVQHLENTDFIIKTDHINQDYIQQTQSENHSLIIVDIKQKMKYENVQDVPVDRFYISFINSKSDAVESLKVYKQKMCMCKNNGLTKLNQLDAKVLTYNKKPYLSIVGISSQLKDNTLEIKL